MRSHPMWVRGLKHHGVSAARQLGVAPYVGAWIETYPRLLPSELY